MKNGDSMGGRCEEIQMLLIEYADRKLSVRQERTIKEHLRICPGCTRFARSLGEISGAVSSEMPVNPDPQIYGRLSARLKTRIPLGRKRVSEIPDRMLELLQYRIPVYQLALGVIIVLFSLSIGKRSFDNTSALYFEESLTDTTEVARNWEFMERQSVHKSISADTVLTVFIVPAL